MTKLSAASGSIDLTAKDIAQLVATAAGVKLSSLGLRFDRVATGVLGRLAVVGEGAAPGRATIILTLTAPIRQPAKTVEAATKAILAMSAEDDPADFAGSMCGNGVRLRVIARPQTDRPNFVGFVHNADIDPARLLGMAENWLLRLKPPG